MGHCWVGVVLSLSPLPHSWGAQPSPLSLHPQEPSWPPQLPAPWRMRRRRKRIHSPGGGGSASAAWKRKRRRKRTERLPIPCLCPGLVLFSGLFADFIGFLQVFCRFFWGFYRFSGVSASFDAVFKGCTSNQFLHLPPLPLVSPSPCFTPSFLFFPQLLGFFSSLKLFQSGQGLNK